MEVNLAEFIVFGNLFIIFIILLICGTIVAPVLLGERTAGIGFGIAFLTFVILIMLFVINILNIHNNLILFKQYSPTHAIYHARYLFWPTAHKHAIK